VYARGGAEATGSSSVGVVLKVFLTHSPEDREAYYGRALPELRTVADVVLNPLERDLQTSELIDAAAGCEVIVAHRSTPGEAAVFSARPELLAFLRCAVDISTIDVDAASAAGVLVGRADKSFVASTAELALALMLDLARNVTESTIDFRADRQPAQRPGVQLRGRVAGIIGYGAIGSYLAGVLRDIGMSVLVSDPLTDATSDGFEQCEFGELLARSDVVLPLAPATDSTTDMIDAEALDTMRPGTMLVNVSRGELLDEDAVAAALDAGHLGGLAMDVGRSSDQRPSPELARRPGVIATPHLGGLTPENADAQAMSSVEQVAAIVEGVVPPRTVNADHATRLRSWWANGNRPEEMP
jgi:D-3-phosphoglycerate dehydrogenase